jgi:hypothetical protein
LTTQKGRSVSFWRLGRGPRNLRVNCLNLKMTQAGAIDSGHTAWMLVSMALVQLMLPGLAFFYAGLLRHK